MSSVFCFDLDNTLYIPEKKVLNLVDNNIKQFIYEKFNCKADEIYDIRKRYHEKYGSTLMGLMKEEDINPLEYLKYIHNIDVKYLLNCDEKLRKILQNLNSQIILITNSYKEYAVRLLKQLGIYDLFDSIFDVVDMGYYYKSQPESYLKVLKKIDVNPYNCVMFDDSWEQLFSAKYIGMITVLVGRNEENCNPDYNILDIYEIPSILDKLNKRLESK